MSTESEIVQLLQKYSDSQTLDVNTPFEQMGLDSIIFVKLKSQTKKKYGVSLNVKTITKNNTISKLAQYIDANK